jgi:hypothetical protein
LSRIIRPYEVGKVFTKIFVGRMPERRAEKRKDKFASYMHCVKLGSAGKSQLLGLGEGRIGFGVSSK